MTAEVTLGDREECCTETGMLGISPNHCRKQTGDGIVLPLPIVVVHKFSLITADTREKLCSSQNV